MKSFKQFLYEEKEEGPVLGKVQFFQPDPKNIPLSIEDETERRLKIEREVMGIETPKRPDRDKKQKFETIGKEYAEKYPDESFDLNVMFPVRLLSKGADELVAQGLKDAHLGYATTINKIVPPNPTLASMQTTTHFGLSAVHSKKQGELGKELFNSLSANPVSALANSEAIRAKMEKEEKEKFKPQTHWSQSWHP